MKFEKNFLCLRRIFLNHAWEVLFEENQRAKFLLAFLFCCASVVFFLRNVFWEKCEKRSHGNFQFNAKKLVIE